MTKNMQSEASLNEMKANKEMDADILQYQTNKLSANCVLLAIVLNVLYFANIFGTIEENVGSYYYTISTGFSVIYNLLFLLFAFMCSEGVKNYKINLSITVIFIGLMQFLRIIYIPLKAFQAEVMSGGIFAYNVVLLIVSGILCIVGGIVGILKALKLKKHLNKKVG